VPCRAVPGGEGEGDEAEVKIGPYETGRVYQGDCLELMKAIPDGSVPMIWTDPPYGHNNNNNDLIHRWEAALGQVKVILQEDARPIENDGAEDMERVLRGMLAEAGRVLDRDCCCCCCCCCGGGGGPKPTFARVADWMDEKPLQFFHAVVWDKGGLGMGWRYRRNYEFVMVAHRRGGKLLWSWEESGPETANVIRIGKILPQLWHHPTPKPVALVEHFLRLHTQPGDLVLDPFAGAGTTGVACARLGREFLGFELDPHWAEVANERIEADRRGVRVEELRMGQGTLDFGDSKPPAE
jgi:16S rRNA G966 N2-methylase RsmD